MLTQWCAPAILCGLFTLPMRNRRIIRACLIGGAACIGIGLAAWLTHSAAMARFPMPGLIYFHVAIGVFVHETGLLRPGTWPDRLRNMFSPGAEAGAPAILQASTIAMIAYFLIPQLWAVVTLPTLGRPYLARVLHRVERRHDYRAELTDLLRDIGPHDVVLSDPQTSWLIPSERGRIVAAIHYELFVPDQPKRISDVMRFFNTSDQLEQARIIAQYGVRWIVLDDAMLDPATRQRLELPAAVVRRTAQFELLRSDGWVREKTAPLP